MVSVTLIGTRVWACAPRPLLRTQAIAANSVRKFLMLFMGYPPLKPIDSGDRCEIIYSTGTSCQAGKNEMPAAVLRLTRGKLRV
jgi:hypothetical protein